MVERIEKVLRNLDAEEVNQEAKKSEISALTKKLQSTGTELSSDINDILELDLEGDSLESNLTKKSVQSEKKKCCPTLLGSADFCKECKHSICSRTCTALHCRNCDFSVMCFPNHEWNEDVEYFFLRTNMPNFEKVSEKLRKKNGSVAYACHCVSFTANKIILLHEEDLPWFCRGHI